VVRFRHCRSPQPISQHLLHQRPIMESECDPTTGICELPAPDEKKSTQSDSPAISKIELLSKANITSLNDDKGNPVPLDSLPSSPLILLYFSAVIPVVSLASNDSVMVSTLSLIYPQASLLPGQKQRPSLYPRLM